MNVLDALLDSTLADPLAASRAATAPVGYIGFDVPLDILLCGERHFSHLPWRTERPTPDADRWLESSFAPWARSMLQDWFDGVFDHFDTVVFTRGDDNAQRLYYYVCELQQRGLLAGPKPLVLDVAQIPRTSSINHNRLVLASLLTQLGISVDALESGRRRANAQRALFARLDDERSGPGHRYERIARASLFVDLEPALQLFARVDSTPARKVLLAGSSPPDERFHRAIEAAGWNVSGDSYQRALRRHGNPIATDCDVLTAVARHINGNPWGPRGFGDRSAVLIDDFHRTGAEAVVLWLAEDDEALAWNVAQQRQLLQQHGIPALVLTRRRWDGADGAADAMQKFLREQK